LLLGKSMMCPTEAFTTKPEPRYLLMVFALAGDSTITSDLPEPDEEAVFFFAVFFPVFLAVFLAVFFLVAFLVVFFVVSVAIVFQLVSY